MRLTLHVLHNKNHLRLVTIDLNHVLLINVRTETKTKSLQYSTLLYSLKPTHCTLGHCNHCAPHCTEQHPVAPFGRKNFRRGRATYLRENVIPKIEFIMIEENMCVSAEMECVCVLNDPSNKPPERPYSLVLPIETQVCKCNHVCVSTYFDLRVPLESPTTPAIRDSNLMWRYHRAMRDAAASSRSVSCSPGN